MNKLLLFLVLLALRGAVCQAQPRPLRVLTISGDWKSQAWYQDVWMQGKGADGKGTPPVLYRGRFVAAQIEKAAPGRFVFTDITNYTGQQYGEEAYFKQFDVIMMGDIVGWSLPPRFLEGLKNFAQNGGGVLYAASWKWDTALLDNTLFEEILPARFGIDSYNSDWKSAKPRLEEKDFQPVVALPAHPITAGLDWAGVPTLNLAFKIEPKDGAQVLLQTPGGAPILAVREFGAGRTAISSSINANDELSSKIGDWKDFGRYYVQLFDWLGANSKRKEVSLRPAMAEVSLTVNANAPLATKPITAKLFSIHASHDDPGLAPLEGETLKNFEALNLRGAFSRFSPHELETKNDNDDPNAFNWPAFNVADTDKQMAQIGRLGLEPLLLVGDFGYSQPQWLWKESNSTWSDPSPQAIAEAGEYVAAVIEHINGGKGGDANYKLNVRYVEIANEPDLKSSTIPGFARLFKGIAARIHRDYPGVQVGTFGGYEIPYLPQFLEAVNPDMDWISRHPYGWTGEMVFAQQDKVTAYMKEHGLRQIPFIVTEWDFWIQGRQKFDYMMTRNFEAVQHDNLLGTLHYRLGQYAEPIYLFGVLWTGWGKEKGAGPKGTPMHDAYDAFWIWRDFRGQRVTVKKTVAAETSSAVSAHLYADATRDGEALNVVLYSDWAFSGEGFFDAARGVRYTNTRVNLRLQLPPSTRARTLTINGANGEGFQVLGEPIIVPAGQKELAPTVEIKANAALSLALR